MRTRTAVPFKVKRPASKAALPAAADERKRATVFMVESTKRGWVGYPVLKNPAAKVTGNGLFLKSAIRRGAFRLCRVVRNGHRISRKGTRSKGLVTNHPVAANELRSIGGR